MQSVNVFKSQLLLLSQKESEAVDCEKPKAVNDFITEQITISNIRCANNIL